jgi:hypothetical protein
MAKGGNFAAFLRHTEQWVRLANKVKSKCASQQRRGSEQHPCTVQACAIKGLSPQVAALSRVHGQYFGATYSASQSRPAGLWPRSAARRHRHHRDLIGG